MTFAVGGDAYEAFMGRYSRGLSAPFADFAGIMAGQRALDVGCGPGILTEELVARLGADAVAAVDPSSSFVEAARASFRVSPSPKPLPKRCRSRTRHSTRRSPSSSSTSCRTRSRACGRCVG